MIADGQKWPERQNGSKILGRLESLAKLFRLVHKFDIKVG